MSKKTIHTDNIQSVIITKYATRNNCEIIYKFYNCISIFRFISSCCDFGENSDSTNKF